MTAGVDVDTAITNMKNGFPFPGYCDLAGDAYRNIASTVRKYLPAGSKVLDFGCGPCDKTAVVQLCGYACSACDDLQDDWHRQESNDEKIIAYTKQIGIDFQRLTGTNSGLPFQREQFDMVMLHDVLEHLHDSPKDLLNDLIELIKPNGYLFITVPNAVNIRKRIDVLRGRTNLPQFSGYYWYPGPWRGHIREYTRDDLEQLSSFLGLDVVELHGCHHMLHKLQRVPAFARSLYLGLTAMFDDWRDSWLLVARKPESWQLKKQLPEEELRKVFGSDCPHYLYVRE